jgi:hypothetical protein
LTAIRARQPFSPEFLIDSEKCYRTVSPTKTIAMISSNDNSVSMSPEATLTMVTAVAHEIIVSPPIRDNDLNFPFDAFGHKEPTLDHAASYLQREKNLLQPPFGQLQEVTSQMKELHLSIKDKGTNLIKNKCWNLARDTDFVDVDGTSPVSTFDALSLSFRNRPTLQKCKMMFEILYSLRWNVWISEYVDIIKKDLHIVFDQTFPTGSCFVSKILQKTCLPNVRAFFQPKKGRRTIGITQFGSNVHIFGPKKTQKKSHEFQLQYIHGYEELMKVCPEAKRVYEELVALPRKESQDSAPVSKILSFPCVTAPPSALVDDLSIPRETVLSEDFKEPEDAGEVVTLSPCSTNRQPSSTSGIHSNPLHNDRFTRVSFNREKKEFGGCQFTPQADANFTVTTGQTEDVSTLRGSSSEVKKLMLSNVYSHLLYLPMPFSLPNLSRRFPNCVIRLDQFVPPSRGDLLRCSNEQR